MLEKIKEIICDFVPADPNEITEDTNLRTDLSMSSFDLINMAVELEKQFGKQISNRDMVSIKTVGDIINFVK